MAKINQVRKQYSLMSRFWVKGEGGTFLGDGRVTLLEKINHTGSISEAARQMNMSYKKAWGLVKSINMSSKSPLVEKTSGGKGGGGTTLTTYGSEVIKSFRDLEAKNKLFLDNELKHCNF